jgi:hypothetical protein
VSGVPSIAALFCRTDSVYRQFAAVDVYDIERDARTWPGGTALIAHPPCRAWGRLRSFAKPREDEKDLARFAVARVRQFGGVLEHPEASSLWADQGLPLGKRSDAWGGFTLALDQSWFGHRARKSTWLYVVGVSPRDVPALSFSLDLPTHVVSLYSGRDRSRCRPEIGKAEREATPPRFAMWLCELARSIQAHRVTPA